MFKFAKMEAILYKNFLKVVDKVIIAFESYSVGFSSSPLIIVFESAVKSC